MAITLQPARRERLLTVTGDIHATLHIPADEPQPFLDGELVGAYYIALSDGSLIRATYCDEPEYEVIIEGAALIEIDAETACLRVGWPVEWISLSSIRNANAVAQKSARNLPLFHPQLGAVSAIV